MNPKISIYRPCHNYARITGSPIKLKERINQQLVPTPEKKPTQRSNRANKNSPTEVVDMVSEDDLPQISFREPAELPFKT